MTGGRRNGKRGTRRRNVGKRWTVEEEWERGRIGEENRSGGRSWKEEGRVRRRKRKGEQEKEKEKREVEEKEEEKEREKEVYRQENRGGIEERV
jgi:hypothetical protein